MTKDALQDSEQNPQGLVIWEHTLWDQIADKMKYLIS